VLEGIVSLDLFGPQLHVVIHEDQVIETTQLGKEADLLNEVYAAITI
jgi:hypothetical protein